MKCQWSQDRGEIAAELEGLGLDEVSLILARSGDPSCAISVRGLVEEGEDVFVEFDKPPTLVLDEGEPYYVFYQREEQSLMRGFSLHVVRQSERFARAFLPEEIFEIQRRKYRRLYTPQQSSLTCIPKNSQRLLTAQILDVSLEGARIFGDLEGIGKGSVLAPLTLTLYFRDRRRPPVIINVAEAVVVREVRVKEKVELSFHFGKADVDYHLLKEYIEQRSHELDTPHD